MATKRTDEQRLKELQAKIEKKKKREELRKQINTAREQLKKL